MPGIDVVVKDKISRSISKKLGTIAAQANSAAKAIDNLNRAMASAGQQLNFAGATTGLTGFSKASKAAVKSTTSFTTASQTATVAAAGMATSVTGAGRAFRGFISGVLLIGAFAGVLSTVDDFRTLENQIRQTVSSVDQLNAIMNKLFEVAQKTRSPIKDMGKLFRRIRLPMDRMGKSMDETITVVETITALLKLSGSTAQEASSGMLQLSQAFNKGKLDGDEFRTVAELMPQVLLALADALDVPLSKIFELSRQGALSANVLVTALLAENERAMAALEKQPRTIGDAFTQLKTALTIGFGEFDKITGFSDKVNTAVDSIRNNLTLLTSALAIFGGALAIGGLTKLIASLGIFLLKLNPIAKILIGVGAALTLLSSAMRDTSKSSENGSVGLSSFGLQIKGITTFIKTEALAALEKLNDAMQETARGGKIEAGDGGFSEKAFDGVATAIKQVIAVASGLFGVITNIGKLLAKVTTEMVKSLSTVLDGFIELAVAITPVFTTMLNAITKKFNDFINGISKLPFGDFMKKFKIPKIKGKDIKNELESVSSSFKEFTESLGEPAKVLSLAESFLKPYTEALKTMDEATADATKTQDEATKQQGKVNASLSSKDLFKQAVVRMSELGETIGEVAEGFEKVDGLTKRMARNSDSFGNKIFTDEASDTAKKLVEADKQQAFQAAGKKLGLIEEYNSLSESVDAYAESLGLLDTQEKTSAENTGTLSERLNEATKAINGVNEETSKSENPFQDLKTGLDEVKESADGVSTGLENFNTLVSTTAQPISTVLEPLTQLGDAATQAGQSLQTVGDNGQGLQTVRISAQAAATGVGNISQVAQGAAQGLNQVGSAGTTAGAGVAKAGSSGSSAMQGLSSAAAQTGSTIGSAISTGATTAASGVSSMASSAIGDLGAIEAAARSAAAAVSSVGRGGGGGSSVGGYSPANPGGFKDGGYTGSAGINSIAGVVHGKEYVMPAQQTAKYRPILEAMRSGKGVPTAERGSTGGTQPIKVSVMNYGSSKISVKQISANEVRIIAREESVRSVGALAGRVVAAELQNRNSYVSKAVNRSR